MANLTQLRDMVNARPFQPFVVSIGNRTFTILHPENAACDLRGKDLVLFDKQGMHHVDMRLVEILEPVQSADESGA
jgi:hypothetical protein